MNAISAFLPLHHAVLQAAVQLPPSDCGPLLNEVNMVNSVNSSPSVSSEYSVVNPVPAHAAMLKYIRTATGQTILFSTGLTHSEMLPPGHKPASAGFCIITDGHLAIPDIGSETLNLGPAPDDRDQIERFLSL